MQPDRLIFQPAGGKDPGPPDLDGGLPQGGIHLIHVQLLVKERACFNERINAFVFFHFQSVDKTLQEKGERTLREFLHLDHMIVLFVVGHFVDKISAVGLVSFQAAFGPRLAFFDHVLQEGDGELGQDLEQQRRWVDEALVNG